MKLRVAVYNMEWMRKLFKPDGQPKTTGDEGARSAQLAAVVKEMDPDILGIVEGPDTTVSGSKTASAQMEAWAVHHGLNPKYKGVHGFPSPGQQELCALFKSNKIRLQHAPVTAASKGAFDETFLVDTTDSLSLDRRRGEEPLGRG